MTGNLINHIFKFPMIKLSMAVDDAKCLYGTKMHSGSYTNIQSVIMVHHRTACKVKLAKWGNGNNLKAKKQVNLKLERTTSTKWLLQDPQGPTFKNLYLVPPELQCVMIPTPSTLRTNSCLHHILLQVLELFPAVPQTACLWKNCCAPWRSPGPSPCSKLCQVQSHTGLLRTLNLLKDGTSTTSLGYLFSCLINLSNASA